MSNVNTKQHADTPLRNAIEARREKLNYLRADVAEVLGISKQDLSQYMRGVRELPLHARRRMFESGFLPWKTAFLED